jgi:hypothetical protein
MTDQTKPVPPWAKVLSLAESVLQYVRDSPPKLFDVSPATQIHIVGMFWRAVRLYDGVLTLLKVELPEESAILARSMFETSMRLQQLEAEPQNRNSLILDWVNYSISQQMKLLQEMKRSGVDTNVNEALAKLEENRKENSKYASELGVKRLQSFLSVKDAAVKFNRKDDYLNFQWSHDSVHGNDAAWMFATRTPSMGTVGLYAKTGDPWLLSSFAHFAARSMADSAKALFAIMGWTLPSRLDQTVADIERILESNPG